MSLIIIFVTLNSVFYPDLLGFKDYVVTLGFVLGVILLVVIGIFKDSKKALIGSIN